MPDIPRYRDDALDFARKQGGEVDGHESVGSGAPPSGTLEEMLRLMRAAIDAASGRETSGEAGEIPEFIARASVLMVMSSLRWGIRNAEIWGRLGPALMSGLQDTPGGAPAGPEGRGILLDELRTCLREFAEVPGDEARLLQAELERLFERIRPATPADRAGPHRRRWKAKP